MNYTTNVSLVNYDIPNVYVWSDIIKDTCLDWKNYSTYSHNLYIILFWVYVISGLIRYIWNPNLKLKEYVVFKTDNKFINKYKLNILEFNILLFDYIQQVTIIMLLSRIFYVYYTIKLSGL